MPTESFCSHPQDLATSTVKLRRYLNEEDKARLASMDEAQQRWIADEERRDREAEERDLKGKGRESGTQEWKEARGEAGDKTGDKTETKEEAGDKTEIGEEAKDRTN